MMVLFSYIITLSKSKFVFIKSSFNPWFLLVIGGLCTHGLQTLTTEFRFDVYSLPIAQFIYWLVLLLLILLVIINQICSSYAGPLTYKTND